MAIQKVFRNKRVGGLTATRASFIDRDEASGIVRGSEEVASRAFDAWDKVKEKQDEANGGNKYLKWNQDAARKHAELSNKYGSDATGLVNAYDEWNDEYVGNIEFGNSGEQNVFFNSQRTTNAVYRKNLTVEEVNKAFQYDNDILDMKTEQSIKNGVVAISNEDEAGLGFMAEGLENYKKRNPGATNEQAIEGYQTLVRQTTGALSQQKVSSGNVYGGFNDIQSLTDAGFYDEIDEELFYQTNAKAMAGAESDARLSDAMQSVSHFTKQEVAEKNGVDTSKWTDAQKKEISTSKRSKVDMLIEAEAALNNTVYENETYYQGDATFNSMVNKGAATSIQKMMDTEIKEYKAGINVVADSARNAMARYNNNGTQADLNAYEEQISKLVNNGENDLVETLNGEFSGSLKTDEDEYNKFSNEILSDTTSEDLISSSNKLNTADKKGLIADYRSQKSENRKNSASIADQFVRDYLGISLDEKIEEVSSIEKRNKYYDMTKYVKTSLGLVNDNTPMTRENIKQVVSSAISSGKVNRSKVKDKYKKGTVFETGATEPKRIIKKYDISKDEYVNIASNLYDPGLTDSEVYGLIEVDLETRRELEDIQLFEFEKEVGSRIIVGREAVSGPGVIESSVIVSEARELKMQDFQRKLNILETHIKKRR